MTKEEFDWMLQGMVRAFRVSEKDECEQLVESIRDALDNLCEI